MASAWAACMASAWAACMAVSAAVVLAWRGRDLWVASVTTDCQTPRGKGKAEAACIPNASRHSQLSQLSQLHPAAPCAGGGGMSNAGSMSALLFGGLSQPDPTFSTVLTVPTGPCCPVCRWWWWWWWWHEQRRFDVGAVDGRPRRDWQGRGRGDDACGRECRRKGGGRKVQGGSLLLPPHPDVHLPRTCHAPSTHLLVTGRAPVSTPAPGSRTPSQLTPSSPADACPSLARPPPHCPAPPPPSPLSYPHRAPSRTAPQTRTAAEAAPPLPPQEQTTATRGRQRLASPEALAAARASRASSRRA
jgi:hypothetical protein